MDRSERTLSSLFLSLLVVGSLVATAPGVAGGADVQPGPSAQQATPGDGSNATVSQERPGSVSEQGDVQRLRGYLERSLFDKLRQSTRDLSAERFDSARSALGAGYASDLRRYSEVANETGNQTDDRTVATLRALGASQREFTNTTATYTTTLRQYRGARARGNESGAREYARDLERLANATRAQNESLRAQYRTLEARTGTETDELRTEVRSVARTVSREQETVRAESFVGTTLDVETNGTDVSFTDPMAITGQLSTDRGEPVDDQRVRLRVGNRLYRTTTNASGSFTVRYRPVSIPANATTVRVQYVPRSSLGYFGARANVSANVTQVPLTLSTTGTPQSVGYGEAVSTRLTATAGGRPVPSLPVTQTLGTTTVGTVTTGNGTSTISQRVPASLATGETTLRVTQSRSDLAVGPAETATAINVTPTETALSVGVVTAGEAVTMRGRLTTAAGASIANQSVRVAFGDFQSTVTTNRTGYFQLQVAEGSNNASFSAGELLVTATFTGTGTNLDGSESETIVQVPGSSGGIGATLAGLVDDEITLLEGVGGGFLLVLIGALVVWSRRDTDTAEPTPEAVEPEVPSTDDDTVEYSREWLDLARSTLSSNEPEMAAVAAYSAVRSRLAHEADLPDALTHREFVTACHKRLESDRLSALSDVSVAYERASFKGSITYDGAVDAIDAATTVVDEESR
ncbi:hypothetical protein NDI56_18675 [Haloarcula sp. S1CR25-12]|uniref:DUF4129 domain-containing protein n=1 Tax=Haloarcula saliterrae TaxID=2950534 RepID=A0ABU2FHX2_9EURY|nr:hypothetical protein [Haloarcula sp. S1CR25-12]MDS0261430.1 hypothetical protein [Haloarcula sp. S1CR25-12]